ncbi:MAG: DUF3781 domain-containing protein [Firmicutes bacterium]|nr:DUF3781 domain-containing protein [Bacillota bacterium]
MTLELEKLHTTPMGVTRIKRNLGLRDCDAVDFCKEQIAKADEIIRKGKNWYAYAKDSIITINAHSYTIITAHKRSKSKI